jgi:ABC-type multidrug transport system fused ATPase/permease subunit
VTIARTLRIAWEAEASALGVMLALTLLPAAIPPLIVAFSQRLVDLIASADRVADARPDLLLLVGGIGGLMIVSGVANVIASHRQTLFIERVRMETTGRFLRHAATVDLGHFDDSDWHDRVARANSDVSWRSGQMTGTLINLTGSAIGLIGMLGILASLHPFLLVLVAGSVVP